MLGYRPANSSVGNISYLTAPKFPTTEEYLASTVLPRDITQHRILIVAQNIRRRLKIPNKLRQNGEFSSVNRYCANRN